MHPSPYTHFDPQALLADLFGNREIVRTVLGAFGDWRSTAEGELRAAADAGSAPQLARITHALRGTLAQIHAAAGADMANALEQRCKSPAPGFVPGRSDIDALLHELGAVAGEVADYLERN
jgi:HPt (histidine-containing phosphotransfer) domain-containing protein